MNHQHVGYFFLGPSADCGMQMFPAPQVVNEFQQMRRNRRAYLAGVTLTVDLASVQNSVLVTLAAVHSKVAWVTPDD